MPTNRHHIFRKYSPTSLIVSRGFFTSSRLHYDRATRTTQNTEDVDIRTIHFGHPRSVQWLSPLFETVEDTGKTVDGLSSEPAVPSDSCLVGVSRDLYSNYSELELQGATAQFLNWLKVGDSGSREEALAEHKAAIRDFCKSADRIGRCRLGSATSSQVTFLGKSN